MMKKGDSGSGLVFHAGFPNAAEDQHEQYMSLDKQVFRHRLSTFLWQLETDIPQMGWSAGSVVVVDRALNPRQNDLLVAVVDEEFMVRKYHQKHLVDTVGQIETSDNVAIWGVITHVLQEYRRQ